MADVTIEIRPRAQFRDFLESNKRWGCLVVHRRGGKTFSSLQKLLLRVINVLQLVHKQVIHRLDVLGEQSHRFNPGVLERGGRCGALSRSVAIGR